MTTSQNKFFFLYNKKVPIKKFSVELTNRCSLACPNCSRTSIDRKGFIHDISKTKQLDLDLIQKIFPAWLKDKNNGFVIDFTGNLGDAIYHPQFHEIITYIKSINIKVQVTTNGSHRSKAWWEKTASILGPEDLIVFSVDGLKDTNHIYRINAKWEDIMEAISICVPHTKVQWKWIVFRHNEHQIEEAK
jgi:MoaA/NifB/PqqE/SkfB family radical SAM enzyme